MLYKNNRNVLFQLQKICCWQNFNVRKTKQNRWMLSSNCVFCGKKKSAFIKDKEFHNFGNISND